MLNSVQLMGRLTADPMIRTTASGADVASFTLASDTGRKANDGSRITNFVECIAWRNRAEFAQKYLMKGRLIVVEGELVTRTYEAQDGSRRKVTEINVSKIHFADSRKDGFGNVQADEAPESSGEFVEVDDEELPF